MSGDSVRRVAVATFGRSDFSILRPLCEQLAACDGFDVGLLVTGNHFDAASGRTVDDVKASGVPLWALVDPGPYERTPQGTVATMANQMTGFAAAVADVAPDLVLILGDRFEAVAAGLAMVPVGVPVGHLSGGSITEGAFDDVFRHCLTKIAALHFCDLPQFARRIQRMGEAPSRIFTTGALGLDGLVTAPRRSVHELAAHFGFDGLQPGYALLTVHSETGLPGQAEAVSAEMTDAVLDALAVSDHQVVCTNPNADPGSAAILERLEAAKRSPVFRGRLFHVANFGSAWYPTAMAHAGFMIGNSSGGIIEAATFELPVVDIGDRQKGREHGANVVHSGRSRAEIAAAIAEVTAPSFAGRASSGNIYGDGRGGRRVVAALSRIDWEDLRRPKPFADPDPAFDGHLLELT